MDSHSDFRLARHREWLLGSLCFFALFTQATVQAVINGTESIEWVTDSAQHIALSRVIRATAVVDPSNHVQDWDVECRVTEALKAEPPERGAFSVAVSNSPPEHDREYLLFFSNDSTVHWSIDLDWTCPRVVWSGYGPVCTQDFQVIRSRESVLAAVRDRLDKAMDQPGRDIDPQVCTDGIPPLEINIPDSTAAFTALWAKSECYLVVPPDPEYEIRAKRLIYSENIGDRMTGACWLGSYPSVGNVALLRSLLEDVGTAHSRADTSFYYPVREEAFEALKAICIDVPIPDGHTDWHWPHDPCGREYIARQRDSEAESSR